MLLFSHSVMSDSATPRTIAQQASLSFTISQSLLKLISIELVIPCNHLIFCWPLPLLPSIFPSIRVFSKWVFPLSSWHKMAKVLELQHQPSVFPMNIKGWFPLGLTGLISLLSRGLSRIFSSITVWKHQFLGAQPPLCSNSHICTRPEPSLALKN